MLLSNDHETHSGLPVKPIEYSEVDAVNKAAMDSFTTGMVKLEYQREGQYTSLYAPLKGRQGVYGVLQIITNEAIEFPKKEIDFIEKFAKIAGHAIESAILYQNSVGLVYDLKLINDVAHKLNSNLKRSEIIMILKHQIMNLGDTAQVGFIHYKKEKNICLKF